MEILRFHNPDNFWRGVYTLSSADVDVALAAGFQWHPTPDEEGHPLAFTDYCAFLDMDQLRNWFPRPRYLKGAQLSIVTVDTCAILCQQVVFNKSDYRSHRPFEGELT